MLIDYLVSNLVAYYQSICIFALRISVGVMFFVAVESSAVLSSCAEGECMVIA